MAYLTEEQISELTNDALRGRTVWVSRDGSRARYSLIEFEANGMKGVVWRATDDLGTVVALKIVPTEEYSGHSLIDEMTEARKLDPNYFARVLFFGDLDSNDDDATNLSAAYKAIATEWVEGEQIDNYVRTHPLTGDEYLLIVEQLFTALAVLHNNGLCHDDLHPGNVLVFQRADPLTNDRTVAIKIIDTGAVKRVETREVLLRKLRQKLTTLRQNTAALDRIQELEQLLAWKDPDDHIRAMECLLHGANSLAKNYHRLDFWERRFFDQLLHFFQKTVDPDLERRLDAPEQVVSEIRALAEDCKADETTQRDKGMATPFDYISAEMIRNDREFSELFSRECPWLEECRSLEPLYIYGPRGCGKSSVLRWLSLKTLLADPARSDLTSLKDVGVYVSCSVELRSRFWLLSDETIDLLQNQIIRFFNLLLLDELFDTLLLMWRMELSDGYQFGFKASNIHNFTTWVIGRFGNATLQPRLQGQSYFDYLCALVRRLRWETWASIQRGLPESGLPDPSLASDICRILSQYFKYFDSRHVTFLVDDYSNQRIPKHLQRKLNQTISFAKQGTPIFKVSSEYNGVDLEGVQEGREVVEINIGEKYTSLRGKAAPRFLTDIINIRLRKAKFTLPDLEQILGSTSYDNMAVAIAEEDGSNPFYYHGVECVHLLCSGDVALALDLIKRIFDDHKVTSSKPKPVPPHRQHETIQRFAHDEVRRIRSIVPDGEELYDIVVYLGVIARAAVMYKRSKRKDKNKTDKPSCLNHLDVRVPAISQLDPTLTRRYDLLTSRAILMPLETSRSRLHGAVERLQMRRIYFAAFKAPLKRDAPIKVDTVDELISLLTNPHTFAQRESKKAGLDIRQLELALGDAMVKPRS